MSFKFTTAKKMYNYTLEITGELYNGHYVAEMVIAAYRKSVNEKGELCLFDETDTHEPTVWLTTQATANFYIFLMGNLYKDAYKDLLPLFPQHSVLAA